MVCNVGEILGVLVLIKLVSVVGELIKGKEFGEIVVDV